MEVMLKSTTKITESDRSINVTNFAHETTPTITLDELSSLQNFQRVTALIKVITNKDPIHVGESKKKKQDVIVGDLTAVAKLTLWEKAVNSLDEDVSYKIENAVVREFKSRKYLSMPKDGAKVTIIDDIGEVDNCLSSDDEDFTTGQLLKAQIVGVPHLDRYKSCYMCKARVEPMEPPLGRCSKCAVMQRLDLCPEQWSAKLLIMASDNPSNIHTLHGFGKIIYELADVPANAPVTAEDLLMIPPIGSLSYTANHVITGFTK